MKNRKYVNLAIAAMIIAVVLVYFWPGTDIKVGKIEASISGLGLPIQVYDGSNHKLICPVSGQPGVTGQIYFEDIPKNYAVPVTCKAASYSDSGNNKWDKVERTFPVSIPSGKVRWDKTISFTIQLELDPTIAFL